MAFSRKAMKTEKLYPYFWIIYIESEPWCENGVGYVNFTFKTPFFKVWVVFLKAVIILTHFLKSPKISPRSGCTVSYNKIMCVGGLLY